jgi:hypothetical protein
VDTEHILIIKNTTILKGLFPAISEIAVYDLLKARPMLARGNVAKQKTANAIKPILSESIGLSNTKENARFMGIFKGKANATAVQGLLGLW